MLITANGSALFSFRTDKALMLYLRELGALLTRSRKASGMHSEPSLAAVASILRSRYCSCPQSCDGVWLFRSRRLAPTLDEDGD